MRDLVEVGGKRRSSWDSYFMRIATEVASRATCSTVGAVLVRDRNILATGYNGSIRDLPHCDEDGHLMEEGHCVRTIHAEANALIQAAKNGVRIDGATLYVTASPCWPCFGLIANAGVQRIVFGEAYRVEDSGPKRVVEDAVKLGIELVSLMKITEIAGYRVHHPVDVEVEVRDGCLVTTTGVSLSAVGITVEKRS